jgi:acyl carrier protein
MSGAENSLAVLVTETISETCNVNRESVGESTSLIDLGVDSFSLATIVTCIEAAYDLEFGTDEVLQFLQAQSVADLICRFARAIEVPIAHAGR